MSAGYHIPQETKDQILSRIKEGIPATQLAREHGVCVKTIYGWLAKQSPGALDYGRLKRERDELLLMVGRLTVELSKAKKGR